MRDGGRDQGLLIKALKCMGRGGRGRALRRMRDERVACAHPSRAPNIDAVCDHLNKCLDL